ncbi:hypothetical protein D3C72_2272740 [compost metagenome]
MLPDKGLQECRMIRHSIEDLGCGHAVALQLQFHFVRHMNLTSRKGWSYDETLDLLIKF